MCFLWCRPPSKIYWHGPDYVIWTFMKLGQTEGSCAPSVGWGTFQIIQSETWFSCGLHCTNSLCGLGRPGTSINRCLCVQNQKPHKKKTMENSAFDLNITLAAVYYNGGNHPICSWFAMMSPSLGWRVSWIKSTSNSTTETHEGWTVLSIDVRRPTQSRVCGSSGWSSWTTTTWELCSTSFVSSVLEGRSS